MFCGLSEKRLKLYRGFFDDEKSEPESFIKKGESSLLPPNYNSADLIGEAQKFQENRGSKKKIVLIIEDRLIYFSKILGIIKFVKYIHLNEVYALFDQDDDKPSQNEDRSGWNIFLFKNSRALKFRFKDWTTYLKFKEAIKKKSILVNFSNQYTFLGYLKSGGFSDVSTIENKLTRNRCAAKMYNIEDLRSNEKNFNRELLKNEISVLKHLRSDYVGNLHEVYEMNEKIVLVMELLGEDLSSHVRLLGQNMKKGEIRNFMKKTLEALSFIHNKGVIHRDIKPENIMFDNEGKKIKIIDFGLSTFVNLEHSYRNQKCGTLHYIAPEMREGSPYDAKVDVYSLGVTFFLLLTGNIKKKLTVEETKMIESFPWQVPDSIRKTADSLAIDLLQKMLQRDPALRISSTQALAHRWFEKKVQFKHQIETNMKTESDQLNFDKTDKASPLENMSNFNKMCSSLNAFDLKSKKPFSKMEVKFLQEICTI